MVGSNGLESLHSNALGVFSSRKKEKNIQLKPRQEKHAVMVLKIGCTFAQLSDNPTARKPSG
jgi:hypothetical protein